MGKLSSMQEKMVNGILEKFKASEQFQELERQALEEKARIKKLENLRDKVFDAYYSLGCAYTVEKNILGNLIQSCDLVSESENFYDEYYKGVSNVEE